MRNNTLADVDALYREVAVGFLVRVHSDDADIASDHVLNTMEIYGAMGFGYGLVFEGICQYFIHNGKNELSAQKGKPTAFSEEEKLSFCEALADSPSITKVELGEEVDLRVLFNSVFKQAKVFK